MARDLTQRQHRPEPAMRKRPPAFARGFADFRSAAGSRPMRERDAEPAGGLSVQRVGETSANNRPCGSVACTIQLPPGTSIGPMRTRPPRVVMRAIAASTLSTLT